MPASRRKPQSVCAPSWTRCEIFPDSFVRHLELRRSPEGLWYRVNEWLDAVPWGDLIASGYFLKTQQAAELLADIAAGMAELHKQGLVIPHLTLDDLLAVKTADGRMTVKIDYKLSRFINPEMPHPQPALAALLAIHPDLQNGRPLDFRTDTWSMGRLFATLLTGEEEWTAALSKLEASAAPPRLKTLVRQMLEREPGERPASAEGIASALRSSAAGEAASIAAAAAAKSAARRPSLALVLVVCLGLAGVAVMFLQFRYGSFSRDPSLRLGRYAEQYRKGVAFVVTAYQLDVDGKPAYANAAEGSAFLVSADGYLLTNRHVACPWLEDARIDLLLSKLSGTEKEVRLRYRVLAWLDGQPAIRQGRQNLPNQDIDQYLEDRYLVQTPQSSGVSQDVRIAGIVPPPRGLRARLRSPLSDDAAFLKLDRVPAGVRPLPLPVAGSPRPRPLAPVLALGFPLGSDQNLGPEVIASATIGHVRRTFENVYQISASIHPGSSGGPVIDAEGRLLGIASALAVEEDTKAGLSDFGMVLPVERALPLLGELKRGDPKWDGAPHYGLEILRLRAAEAVDKRDWSGALKAVAGSSAGNRDPKMLELTALLQYGNGNSAEARKLLDRAISEMPDDAFPRFLRYAFEWRENPAQGPTDPVIRDAEWDAPAEFFRFACRVMRGDVPDKEALEGWEDGAEKSVLMWAVGQKHLQGGNSKEAARLFRDAAAEAGQDTPERLLALADLSALERKEGGPAGTQPADKASAMKRLVRSRIARSLLARQLGEAAGSEENQIKALAQLMAADREDSTVLVDVAFRLAGLGAWEQTAQLLDFYARRPHRPCAISMSAYLLRAEVMALQGQGEKARAELAAIAARKDWPWYPSIARDLIGPPSTGSALAGQDAVKILTLEAARGIWAEANGDPKAAARHYRESLDSYLSSWAEYRFALNRIKQLREAGTPAPAEPKQ